MPVSLSVQAMSCAAHIYVKSHYYSPFVNTPTALSADCSIFRAAVLANSCATFGFVTPVVLHVADFLLQIGRKNGIDVRRDKEFSQYTNLWRVFDQYEAEVAATETEWRAKILKVPNMYRCAAKGCGIGSFKKKALRRCAGKCPMPSKPHYCSEWCQRKVCRSISYPAHIFMFWGRTGPYIGSYANQVQVWLLLWRTTVTLIGSMWGSLCLSTVIITGATSGRPTTRLRSLLNFPIPIGPARRSGFVRGLSFLLSCDVAQKLSHDQYYEGN